MQISEDSSAGCGTVFSFSQVPAGAGEESHLGGSAHRCWQLDPHFPPSPLCLGKCSGVRMVSEAEKNGKFNYDIKSGLEIQSLPTCEPEMRDTVS